MLPLTISTPFNCTSAVKNVSCINYDIIRANTQLKQIITFIPTLVSVLLIFITSLIFIFISNIETETDMSLIPVVRTTLGIVILLLVASHLIILVKLFWSLISSRFAANESNREIELRITKNMESKVHIDYEAARKKDLDTILEAYKLNKE